MKFGGTSVGDADKLIRVSRRIAAMHAAGNRVVALDGRDGLVLERRHSH